MAESISVSGNVQVIGMTVQRAAASPTWDEIINKPSTFTPPQATGSVLGGIKADEKTSAETNEVKIDAATGKLYAGATVSSVNGKTGAVVLYAGDIKESSSGIDTVADTEEKLRRRINALYAANEGKTYDYETDSGAAFTKTVPSGSVGGTLDSFGGRSVSWNQIAIFHNRGSSISNYGITVTPSQDRKSVSISGTSTYTSGDKNFYFTMDMPNAGGSSSAGTTIEGHKYYFSSGNANWCIYPYLPSRGSNTVSRQIYSPSSAGAFSSSICPVSASVVASGTVIDLTLTPIVVDLTQMFGSGYEPSSLDDERIAFIDAYALLHPDYNLGELVSAYILSIVSKDADSAVLRSFSIPAAVQSLPGYGWGVGGTANTVDLANQKYIQRITAIALDEDGNISATIPATPVETDISSLISSDNFFETETGGKLVFQQNGTQLPVPNTETMIVKLSEV